MLKEYMLPCDARFYTNYAKPLVSCNSSLYDLDVFDTVDDSKSTMDFTQAFTRFQTDKAAQYEMHPKFGRYAWDIGDQWYQKWNVLFSMENMWQWSGQIPSQSQDPYSLEMLQPWLDHITERHHIHPHHRQLLENICGYLLNWQKSNKPLSNAGTFRLNTIPFYPPSWFTEKELQSNVEEGDHLASSYFARFAPPYRIKGHTPERWDLVFLKGLTFDPTNEKFDIDPSLIASIIPLYGLTVHFDENTGYSYLMMVMRKASFGNLETNLQNNIPTDYQKPRRQALSITKAVKDLHWEYIHGNVHPRNILFNFDDTLSELVDATFMQRKQSAPSTIPPLSLSQPSSSSTSSSSSSSTIPPLPSQPNASASPTPPQLETEARKTRHSQYHCLKLKKGGMSGRWPYVAPEIAQGLTGPTTEADIYSLGVILWQLISRVTFPSNAPVDPWVFRIEPIPGILPEWEQLYADCLVSDPAKRPSAYMVYRRLEKMNITTPRPLSPSSASPTSSSSLSTTTNATTNTSNNANTYTTSNSTTTALPIDQATMDYIHKRRNEIDKFMEEHQDQFSSPNQRLTQLREDVILSASVTRSINHGLESYPSPVQGFSSHEPN
ncbi:kinase-like domain-containing protein [Absidia repens]|uniref:Kinase-like domain-containing protein n=1 Tax=Absidia repens TaxID=90262 RepID=A0A1X2IT28_9FUNG|nr:kinase-like domain-containing protein [Absidia repens]